MDNPFKYVLYCILYICAYFLQNSFLKSGFCNTNTKERFLDLIHFGTLDHLMFAMVQKGLHTLINYCWFSELWMAIPPETTQFLTKVWKQSEVIYFFKCVISHGMTPKKKFNKNIHRKFCTISPNSRSQLNQHFPNSKFFLKPLCKKYF